MSILDRIQDSFKYLDKNGLKKVLGLIKNKDAHWTGTHAEYEAQKDTIPAYAILHFTDDYDDSVGVVDKIENNNMNGVTSNAVYDALAPIGTHVRGQFSPFGTIGQHDTNLVLTEGTWLVIMTLLVGIHLSGDMYMTAGETGVSKCIRASIDGTDQTSTLNALVTVAASTTKVVGLYQMGGTADVNGDGNYWYVDAYRIK